MQPPPPFFTYVQAVGKKDARQTDKHPRKHTPPCSPLLPLAPPCCCSRFGRSSLATSAVRAAWAASPFRTSLVRPAAVRFYSSGEFKLNAATDHWFLSVCVCVCVCVCVRVCVRVCVCVRVHVHTRVHALLPISFPPLTSWSPCVILADLPEHIVVNFPSLSPTMETGTLQQWNVAVGYAHASTTRCVVAVILVKCGCTTTPCLSFLLLCFCSSHIFSPLPSLAPPLFFWFSGV